MFDYVLWFINSVYNERRHIRSDSGLSAVVVNEVTLDHWLGIYKVDIPDFIEFVK